MCVFSLSCNSMMVYGYVITYQKYPQTIEVLMTIYLFKDKHTPQLM